MTNNISNLGIHNSKLQQPDRKGIHAIKAEKPNRVDSDRNNMSTDEMLTFVSTYQEGLSNIVEDLKSNRLNDTQALLMQLSSLAAVPDFNDDVVDEQMSQDQLDILTVNAKEISRLTSELECLTSNVVVGLDQPLVNIYSDPIVNKPDVAMEVKSSSIDNSSSTTSSERMHSKSMGMLLLSIGRNTMEISSIRMALLNKSIDKMNNVLSEIVDYSAFLNTLNSFYNETKVKLNNQETKDKKSPSPGIDFDSAAACKYGNQAGYNIQIEGVKGSKSFFGGALVVNDNRTGNSVLYLSADKVPVSCRGSFSSNDNGVSYQITSEGLLDLNQRKSDMAGLVLPATADGAGTLAVSFKDASLNSLRITSLLDNLTSIIDQINGQIEKASNSITSLSNEGMKAQQFVEDFNRNNPTFFR